MATEVFNFLYSWGQADWVIPDPGNAGAIPAYRPGVCYLRSAGAETRTLANPPRSGLLLAVNCLTYVGNITLTVAAAFDAAGDTTVTFSVAGQTVWFQSIKYGTGHRWRLIAGDGFTPTTTATSTELNLLSGLVSTAAEINRTSALASRVVTHSSSDANTLALTAALHDGKTLYVTKTDGLAITLPIPVAGMRFRIVIGATIASASSIKSVAGTHLMIGHATMGNDSNNATVDWQALAASTYDTIDLLGTGNSTGGIEGQRITIEAMSATRWFVEIQGDAAGTEATPFGDTVA